MYEKTSLRGLRPSLDTNRAVQPQMTRGLKVWISEVEGLYYLCSVDHFTYIDLYQPVFAKG